MRLYNDKTKLHKVKARKSLSLIIVYDPTKAPISLKLPKWLFLPAFSFFIFLIAFMGIKKLELHALNTQYIHATEEVVEVSELIKEKSLEINRLYDKNNHLIHENDYLVAQLDLLEEKTTQLASYMDSLNDYKIEIQDKIKESTGTTIAIQSVDSLLDENPPANMVTNSTTERVELLIHGLDLAINQAFIHEDALQFLDREIDKSISYWQAYPSGYPLSSLRITDKFGWRQHPVYRRAIFHKGIDLAAYYENIYATGNGIITFSGYKSGYGYTLIINHGYGYETLYAHNSKNFKQVGDVVNRGDIIGISGASGVVTGPHLHYEIIYNGTYKDPLDYMKDFR